MTFGNSPFSVKDRNQQNGEIEEYAMGTGFSIAAAVVVLVETLAIAAAIHAVMHARTSQGAIAWGISLITFPWLTLPLYAIFGRGKFSGYMLLRNLKNEKVQHVLDRCQKQARQGDIVSTPASPADSALMQLADLPAVRFNDCELLIDGEATFEAIFKGIETAADYILVQFYIVNDDDIGRALQQRLMAKAAQGVRVYFLYDEIGSYKLPGNYLQLMNSAGIVTSAFKTTRGRRNKLQLNFRNHRKIVVIDGAAAYVGGHNVGDEYLSRHPKFGQWRDTHVQVTGPVVQAVQYAFLQDWYWATSELPDLNWNLAPAPGGECECLMIASGPADRLDTCGLMFAHVINSARERIWIASPYFVPDALVLGALKLAALRGVDVRILIPEKPDHRLVWLASFSYYSTTLPLGIRIFRYQAGFMHQKVFLVDRSCAAVGTANLDNRSFRLNFEMTLLLYGKTFIADVEKMLVEDFSCSREETLEKFSGRSYLFRLGARFASLLSPIL